MSNKYVVVSRWENDRRVYDVHYVESSVSNSLMATCAAEGNAWHIRNSLEETNSGVKKQLTEMTLQWVSTRYHVEVVDSFNRRVNALQKTIVELQVKLNIAAAERDEALKAQNTAIKDRDMTRTHRDSLQDSLNRQYDKIEAIRKVLGPS